MPRKWVLTGSGWGTAGIWSRHKRGPRRKGTRQWSTLQYSAAQDNAVQYSALDCIKLHYFTIKLQVVCPLVNTGEHSPGQAALVRPRRPDCTYVAVVLLGACCLGQARSVLAGQSMTFPQAQRRGFDSKSWHSGPESYTAAASTTGPGTALGEKPTQQSPGQI